MNDRKMSLSLVAFYMAATFLSGCIPEDSLQWSEDGTVGLMNEDGSLTLLDERTGRATMIAEENVQYWPGLSKDGNWIAYSQAVKCESLEEGLKSLPPGQVKMIANHARLMRERILREGVSNGEFPHVAEGPIECAGEYRNWVIRYVCEKADQDVINKIGTEALEKGKQSEVEYFKLVVVPRDALADKRVVTTTVLPIFNTRFSPDKRHVAYLINRPEKEGHSGYMQFSLFVASLQEDVKGMLVRSPVAFGYDWRGDGRAIAYMHGESQDGDFAIGSLNETMVLGQDDELLANPAPIPEEGAIHTHVCTGHTEGHVGVMFYPWIKVEYGPSGRILFSSASVSLPSVERDEPGWSVFCYDSVTASITDVVPPEISVYTNQAIEQAMNICQFTMSPDKKKMLLPIQNNRFICYKLGSRSAEFGLEESEGFGEDSVLDLAPAWKGNDKITCLVSENSRYLGEEKSGHREIVVLGVDGEFRQILREKWPEISDISVSGNSTEPTGIPIPVDVLR